MVDSVPASTDGTTSSERSSKVMSSFSVGPVNCRPIPFWFIFLKRRVSLTVGRSVVVARAGVVVVVGAGRGVVVEVVVVVVVVVVFGVTLH